MYPTLGKEASSSKVPPKGDMLVLRRVCLLPLLHELFFHGCTEIFCWAEFLDDRIMIVDIMGPQTYLFRGFYGK